MSVTSGFFNSVNYDRVYDAGQMSSLFDGIIQDGVFRDLGDHFAIAPSSGLSVSVGTGRAWFNHTWTANDSPLVLWFEDPNMVYDRIDAIVLEVNLENAVRSNTITIVKGTPLASPVPPTLINTATVHQYLMAHVSIPVSLTDISGGNITSYIGTTEFPYIIGTIETVGPTNIIDGAVHQNHLDANASKVVSRQGSDDGGDWMFGDDSSPLVDSDPTKVAIQIGSAYTNSGDGTISVNFPRSYSGTNVPLVLTSIIAQGLSDDYSVQISSQNYNVGFIARLTKHIAVAPYHEAAPDGVGIAWVSFGYF